MFCISIAIICYYSEREICILVYVYISKSLVIFLLLFTYYAPQTISKVLCNQNVLANNVIDSF